jgi:uncharacterized protein (TIGR02996 family)
MTPRDALLAAVCAAPDDDLPRLVYADWLDEHGDPIWAELIRVQCAFDRHPQRDAALALIDGSRQREYGVSAERRHATELFLRSLRLMPQCPHWNQCEDVQWVRGFIDRLACHAHVWFGGPCEVCAGAGTVPDAVGTRGVRRDCLQCAGAGRFDPGIGPAVVRDHPVRRVDLTNVGRPFPFVGVTQTFTLGDRIPAAEVGPLGAFLNAPAVSADGVFQFPSREDAQTALSAAAISWAKSVVGQPGK